jgi:cell division septum initiation protein DivIVA
MNKFSGTLKKKEKRRLQGFAYSEVDLLNDRLKREIMSKNQIIKNLKIRIKELEKKLAR